MPTGKPLVGMELRKPLEPHDRQCRSARSVGQGSPVGRRRCAPLGLAWSEHDATLMIEGGVMAMRAAHDWGAVR